MFLPVVTEELELELEMVLMQEMTAEYMYSATAGAPMNMGLTR